MIAIRHTFAHLDMMPRCVVTRRIAHFCAHCTDNSGGGFPDGNRFAPSVLNSFHDGDNARAQ